ncbi:hypothetical protein [Streptomyces sp. NPDC047028]|uniref:hypothetical protein n=1 Tax=Streptomyces sp. NPDC047028 TaxID=3155793 RepID=UPI003401F9E7
MSSFFDRAKRDAERNLLAMGKDKVAEYKEQRSQQHAGAETLKRLGAAYYAERHGTGTPEATQQALQSVEQYVAAHGDGVLRG